MYFYDDLEVENYYRRLLHKNSLDSIPILDFAANDQFNDEDQIVFGSAFEFEPGDTIINTVMQITPEYYDFLQSLFGAIFSNGNPFAQPGRLLSNIESDVSEPEGIFTCFRTYRDSMIVN